MPSRVPPRSRRPLALAATLLPLTTLLSGCSEDSKNFFLPRNATDTADQVAELWNGAWIAGLAIGALVWGLMLYVAVRYRQRPGDTRRPAQTRYNVPIEILYTVVPVLMVVVFYARTLPTEAAMLDTSKKPDNVVNVVGKQWSWDFNYVNDGVHTSGVKANLAPGKKGELEKLPTLYLPVNKRTEFVLTTRDVIHTFWVINFVQKMDIVPGKVNSFQVVPRETGTYQGKCAELCGAYHSEMLFQVKVVNQDEYDKQMAALKADENSRGMLPTGLNREDFVHGEAKEKLKDYPQLMPTEAPAGASEGTN